MCAVCHQLVSGFQNRHDFLHLITQRLQALLHFLLRRALTNQAADVAKFRFHFRTLLRGNIDANRPFQVFKDLKIGHLHFSLRLVALALLIQLISGIEPLRDVIGKGAEILRGERQRAEEQQTGEKTAAGGNHG